MKIFIFKFMVIIWLCVYFIDLFFEFSFFSELERNVRQSLYSENPQKMLIAMESKIPNFLT
mgnify:FL=1